MQFQSRTALTVSLPPPRPGGRGRRARRAGEVSARRHGDRRGMPIDSRPVPAPAATRSTGALAPNDHAVYSSRLLYACATRAHRPDASRRRAVVTYGTNEENDLP
ncbi:hypothetical protein EVAR_51899_1 [Eumeta japonica]|uniref:Uncharacterized protein n=1 Tax=Eumeta variegata TaxID=151549 RepID=A0A4C1XHK5_EUMVA|nr:hypothetical protein EVAR_51899_1 [Eumeta japonica]